ncbi:DUF1878 family protein [Oceanobacillus damuensis]|uniref:DUF1878 family protein n=1 Tax=Oceanobacillus damuensis TaxID=937928 RepID=UPI0009FBACA6|nr:DUF1878 family protein [Oceanobacillus damuensis]
MEGLNNTNDGSSFHIQLLSKIIDMNKYPLTKLIIENNITREEYMELMKMIQRLNDTYELQKEEGFLDFSSLLVHFAGMLNEKLDPNETIEALAKEKYFPLLMAEFRKILDENEKRYRRK